MDSNNNRSIGLDDEFKLFCWVLGQSDTPFSVKIGKGETVHDLKKMLKKEKEQAFADIGFDELNIWKVSNWSSPGVRSG